MRKMLVCALTLAALTALALPLGVGSKVPDIALAKSVGGRLKLKAVFPKKDATILYFWSFEAGAHPEDFVMLQSYYGSEFTGLGVVAICVNGTDTQAMQWQKENGFTYDSVADNTANGTTARLFGVKRYPALFVVNREGIITHRFDTFDDPKIRLALDGLGVKEKGGTN